MNFLIFDGCPEYYVANKYFIFIGDSHKSKRKYLQKIKHESTKMINTSVFVSDKKFTGAEITEENICPDNKNTIQNAINTYKYTTEDAETLVCCALQTLKFILDRDISITIVSHTYEQMITWYHIFVTLIGESCVKVVKNVATHTPGIINLVTVDKFKYIIPTSVIYNDTTFDFEDAYEHHEFWKPKVSDEFSTKEGRISNLPIIELCNVKPAVYSGSIMLYDRLYEQKDNLIEVISRFNVTRETIYVLVNEKHSSETTDNPNVEFLDVEDIFTMEDHLIECLETIQFVIIEPLLIYGHVIPAFKHIVEKGRVLVLEINRSIDLEMAYKNMYTVQSINESYKYNNNNNNNSN